MRRPRDDPISSTTSSPSTSQNQRHESRTSQEPRVPRYHINHFDSGGMPVSLWGMDRRDVWRTCFCFHVRTVTIFIGVWYLMMYILALSFHAALLMYEPVNDNYSGGGLTTRQETMLPTPVSKVGPELKQFGVAQPEKLTIDQTDQHRSGRVDSMRNGPLTLMVMDTSRKATSQVILLTVCNMLITLLMVYGAVRGKPSYLMPFFVLRVFDFCIFCLTMVGYFSYLPTEGIMNTQGMPFRDELLKMDAQLLSFITLVFIVAFIAVKAYIIGVIWNCYKYLMLRNTVIRGVIAYRHDDPTNIMGLQQNLLPDLPDYETAVNDPRYAKKPPAESGPSQSTVTATGNGQAVIGSNPTSIVIPPPPPYSVAVASEPLHFAMASAQQNNNNITNNNNVDTTAATAVVPQTSEQGPGTEQASPSVVLPVHQADSDSSGVSETTAQQTGFVAVTTTGTFSAVPVPDVVVQHHHH